MENLGYPGPSAHSELLHTYITRFTYGEYQSTHDIRTCLSGIYKTLNIHITLPILSQPYLDFIILRGDPPYHGHPDTAFGIPRHTPANYMPLPFAEYGTKDIATS